LEIYETLKLSKGEASQFSSLKYQLFTLIELVWLLVNEGKQIGLNYLILTTQFVCSNTPKKYLL